nr:PREDICTED: ankyrin-3-like isoform X1 [Daucus carota subsp. sativus]
MEREILYKNALDGILSAKSELRERAKRLSKHNRTILHVASKDGSIKQVQYILQEFAKYNFLGKLDSNEETALHVAASYGHTEVVKGLIDAARSLPLTSADDDPIAGFRKFVRQPNNKKNTALHLAVSNGNVDCAELLVKADPDDRHIQNDDGYTPIYLAAEMGYNETVKMFCRVCTTPTFHGPEGTTALHAAIKKLSQAKEEDRDVVKALIEAAVSSFPSVTEREAFLRQPDKKNMETALHLAVVGEHLDVVNLILEADSTYPHDDKNRKLKTPIYIAAEQGYTNIVKRLCKTSEFGYTTLGPKNQTALHAAILGRDADCVTCLLERAPHLVTYVDNRGWTPLHFAAFHKFDSILDDIIDMQKFVGYESLYGDKAPTPLCVAAQGGHISTVKKLMTSLPSVSCSDVNHDSQNILHIAASKSDKEMVQCILKCCPKDYTSKILNHKDVHGNTPLHVLIGKGCFVSELINHKDVDTMARNKKNWTPLDMLYSQGEIKMGQIGEPKEHPCSVNSVTSSLTASRTQVYSPYCSSKSVATISEIRV